MLWELDIENVAVIQKVHIKFSRGFNVFTGETGAGKSIMLEAIGAVLGSRTSREIIRTGESKAVVTALFGDLSDDVIEFLNNIGFETPDNELLISREITPTRSLCYINGRISTVAMLKNIGNFLINIHGQRDNNILADTESHRNFIDSFGNHNELLKEYSECYSQYRQLFKRLEELSLNEKEKRLKLDSLKYQIDEITSASLHDGEEEELIARKKIIKNSKTLFDSLSNARMLLVGDDNSEGVVSMLEQAEDFIGDSVEYIKDMEPIRKKVTDYRYELDEMSEIIRSNLDELSFDENELEDIEERLNTIFKLKRKYGDSITEILDYLQKAEEEYLLLQDNENNVKNVNNKLTVCENKTKILAGKLTKAREKAAQRFTNSVEAELKTLDMPDVRLIVHIRPTIISKSGKDDLEFLISVNAGEEPKSLAKVASGGEMSRIMLAIKNVVSAKDDVYTQIFDEIDSGISGKAAQKVGKKLYEVSRDRQIICVTHLAQVAAFADTHLLIEKKTVNGKTFTKVYPLGDHERAREIARITSGEPITELAIANATQLIQMSRNNNT